MTGTDQVTRSADIWTKISTHLRDEVDQVVYGPWLSPLSFVETDGHILRLAHTSAFRRDWVVNTYEEYIIDLWHREDANITALEIVVQPKSRPRPDEAGEDHKPKAASAKSAPVVETQQATSADTVVVKRTPEPYRKPEPEDLESTRKQMGKVGVWSRSPYFYEAEQAKTLAVAAEELGYSSLWIPGFDGGHVFDRCRIALEASSKLMVATGVVNIWRHTPAEVAETVSKLRADSGGRFLVGMGGSHRFLIGPEYDKIKPLAKMRSYLDDLDAAGLPPEHRLLGALGPKMLELSGQRTVGAHPTFIPPEFTGAAREILGDGPLLMPELTVILESDPAAARAYARKFANLYFKGPNYANMLRRFGFDDEDFAGLGSDRLIDAVVAWGTPEEIAARVRAHLDAGADHVSIQSRGTRNEVEVWRELAPFLVD